MLEGASQLESRFLALEILILKEGNMQTRENHGGYEGNGEPTIWKYLYLGTEKAMAPHSSTLAWKILWMEEPGRLQSMRLLRVRYN